MAFQELIDACIGLKKGSKEFILSGEDGSWFAGIGNPTTCVMLGEAEPEFRGDEARDPLAALESLHSLLVRHGGVVPDPRTPEERAHDEMIDAMSDDELRAWNAERLASAKPGQIVSGYLRGRMVVAESINSDKIQPYFTGPVSQEP